MVLVIMIVILVVVEGIARPELHRRKKMIRRRKHMTDMMTQNGKRKR